MKKTKLIASLCMIALTICCLAFGVYAGITANFTASGSITFSALNVDVDLVFTIDGTTNADATYYITTNTSRSSHAISGQTFVGLNTLTAIGNGKGYNNLNLEFNEFAESPEITLTIDVYNYTEDFAIQFDSTFTFNSMNVDKLDIDDSLGNIGAVAKYSGSNTPTAKTSKISLTPKANAEGFSTNNDFTWSINILPFTTLANTEWIFNETLSSSLYDITGQDSLYYVSGDIKRYNGTSLVDDSFDCFKSTYSNCFLRIVAIENESERVIIQGTSMNWTWYDDEGDPSNWISSEDDFIAVRTISITGGADATNNDLINWMIENATRLS